MRNYSAILNCLAFGVKACIISSVV